ncbi:MAG: UDP-3-O-(3-hydroxymyristoyl)glucosamine N-acyltransferase [Bacteriovoracaceae bacterium]|jgi:UDP-3-O-[3-hydroxymyristoyl] glucosamine N-acyltransferase|nr:hypothetical protein [Halobacteriovoraceae bacterium]MDP7320219.1 UDP-3-O-(3-hydroxymyristoyl)glucosamine N-acyltransferase [Bacteriovoracaceae bacterium]
MIDFENLKIYDSSLSSVGGDQKRIELRTISHSDDPLDQSLIFIKNKRFYKHIGRRSDKDSFKQTVAVVQEDFWLSLEMSAQDELAERFAFIATTKSVDQSMCLLSKPFYDLLFQDINYQVDGRQMGSAVIDASAQIAQGVFIGENVKIGKDVRILPGCVILPEVEVLDGTVLFPNITIYPYTKIGKNCRIHAGTVIGCDGFGYNFFEGSHHKIWHLGGVVIGDDVEIGCNTMIDAGAFTPTEIGRGSKVDNDVQLSHNVKVAEHVIICGKTGLAGSVEVENYCAFGAGAGVAPSAIIGQGAQVAARAVVSENAIIPPGEIVGGHPARPLKEWMRSQATLRKLSKK